MRLLVVMIAALALAGCAAQPVWAPDEAVAAARYQHPGPTEIALVTSLNDRSGAGAHSALLINASERVLFDPAGNWDDPNAPERNDVRFGMTPQMEVNYFAYQSHGPYHAVIQRLTVPPALAEQALELAKANGAVAPALCASATSGLLRQLPGFEGLPATMFPATLMEAFSTLPGVRTTIEMGSPDPNEPDLVPRFHPIVRTAISSS